MQGVQRQGIWLAVAVAAGVGLAIIATVVLAGHLRQKELGEAVTAQTAKAEDNARDAREAANQARRAREQAEELVEFFLGELQSELAPIGRVDVYEEAAERTLSYFESLPPTLMTPETEASRAGVLASLSQARFDRGDLTGAVLARREALTVWRALLAEHGENDVRIELGFALGELGVLLNANGETAEARKAYLEALEVLEQASAESASVDIEHGRASAHFGLGEIERLGENPQAALAEYSRAEELIDLALEEEPESIAFLESKMTILNKRGSIHSSTGEFEGAETAYLQSLEIARSIVAHEPEDRRWLKEVATPLNNLGTLLDENGAHDRAMPFLREALEMREALVAWDPRNGRWQADLANSWHNLAMLHHDLEQSDEALAAARKALAGYRHLVSADPDTPAWAERFKSTLAIHAEELEVAGRDEDARALYAETLALGAAKGRESAGASWEKLLSSLHSDAARMDGAAGNPTAEVTGQLLSLEAPAGDYERLPSDNETTYQLALGYSELGIALRKAGRERESLQPFILCRYLLERGVEPGYKLRDMYLDDAEHDQLGALVASGLRERPEALVPRGTTWNYWDNSTNPGDDWAGPDFDDQDWPRGPAKLGYGEGDEATRLHFGDDQDQKNLTVWFRHRFELLDPSALRTLRLNLLRDDGAVVHLNGREILRDGMPPGRITPTTRAAITVMNWEELIFRRHDLVPGDLPLRAGTNVIAVEIHQNEPPSSDLSFDLELLPDYAPPAPLEGLDVEAAAELLGKTLPPVLRKALGERLP